jgi:hypothetical protein
MILYIYMFVVLVTVYHAIYVPNYLKVKKVILNTNQTTDHSAIYLVGDAQEKAKLDHMQEYGNKQILREAITINDRDWATYLRDDHVLNKRGSSGTH